MIVQKYGQKTTIQNFICMVVLNYKKTSGIFENTYKNFLV